MHCVYTIVLNVGFRKQHSVVNLVCVLSGQVDEPVEFSELSQRNPAATVNSMWSQSTMIYGGRQDGDPRGGPVLTSVRALNMNIRET